MLLSKEKGCAKPYNVFSNEEWCEISNVVPFKGNDIRVEILEKYHNKVHRESYEKIIDIDCLELLDKEAITTLQQDILKHMHKKEIVIETLPTSNVRIGQHHNFDTYHLWNWIKWEKEGKSIPPIVLGTDDAGIFATNIYNEYANIYCHLTNQCKLNRVDAIALIEKFDNNSRVYRFS